MYNDIMKIVITSAHSFEGETGSALIAKTLAEELSKEHKVLYLRLGQKFGIQKRSNNLSYLIIPSLNINNICVPLLTQGIRKKIYKELAIFGPDIIHGENIIFGGLLTLIWASEQGIPYVVTFHWQPQEGMVYTYPHLKANRLLAYLDFMLTKTYISTYLKHVDRVIALNKVITKGLKLISPKTKYTIIDNGIHLERYKALKIRIPKDKIEFIFPGSYIGRKNQEFLVNVFRFLPKNYILNLYGNKISGFLYAQKLEKLVKKYNLKNVNINDYLDENGLLNAYDKAHYFVSASIKEVQSLVVIEGLAAGKPIIALENETTKDVVTDGCCLILPQTVSPELFARNLKLFVEKTNKNYQKTSVSCRNLTDRFDIKSTTIKTVDVYENVILESKNNQGKHGGIFILKTFFALSEIASTLEIIVANLLKVRFKLSQFFAQ
jgi:glycosyltransferase involved in cell wall biosynthesis